MSTRYDQHEEKIEAESVDLIYLDPPFFSNRHYEVIWGDEAEVRSFDDRWEGGVEVYAEWMAERLRACHRVLKPSGSIYLHCDWHAAHHLRLRMDNIFGQKRFHQRDYLALPEMVSWNRTLSAEPRQHLLLFKNRFQGSGIQ